MYPTLVIFLLSLISSCFSQFDPKLYEQSTDLIKDLFIKVRVNNGSLSDFRSFKNLLDRRHFLASYHFGEFMGYDKFIHFLKTRRRTFTKVELMPNVYQNMLLDGYFEPVFTLKLTHIMNYTVTEKYHFKAKFLRDGELRIKKLDIDLDETIKSIWVPRFLKVTDFEARDFARSMSELIPLKINKVDFAEDNFMALIDTDYDHVLSFDDFMSYMKIFNQNHEVQEGSNRGFEVITEANDHIVFRFEVPTKNMENIEKWDFEVEALYIHNSWNVVKIFVRHPFDDNQVILERAVQKLYVKLKHEFQSSLQVSNIIEIPELLAAKLKPTSYKICAPLIAPGNEIKIKLPMWTESVEIHGILEMNAILIQLYFPNDGSLVDFVFIVEYTPKIDAFEIIKIRVQCPEIRRPDHQTRKFKNISMDSHPTIVHVNDADFQFHPASITKHKNKIADLLIKAIVQRGTSKDIQNFLNLLDQRDFIGFYYDEKSMSYDGLLHFLKTQKRKFKKAQVSLVLENTPRTAPLVLILQLTNIMNYTIAEKYNIKMKFVDEYDKKGKITRMTVGGGYTIGSLNSTWEPEYLEGTHLEARGFAKSMCEFIPFNNAHKTDFASNFMALIDTDYNDIFKFDDFMVYMYRFNQKYEVEPNCEEGLRILTEANDHIVFRTKVSVKYENELDFWNFDFEASYIHKSWQIVKIFVRHPFEDNQIIMERAAKELYVNIRNQFKNSLQLSNIINLDELTDKVPGSSCRICIPLKVPGDEFKIKIPVWTGNAEIHGVLDLEEILIQLYFPEDDSRLISFIFMIDYNAKIDDFEVKNVQVECPDIRLPEKQVMSFSGISMDWKPIVIPENNKFKKF